MREKFTDFENSLRDSMEGFELPYDKKGWQELEMKMEGRNASYLNTVAAAVVTALIVISGVTFVILNTNKSDTIMTENTVHADKSVVDQFPSNEEPKLVLTDNSSTEPFNTTEDNKENEVLKGEEIVSNHPAKEVQNYILSEPNQDAAQNNVKGSSAQTEGVITKTSDSNLSEDLAQSESEEINRSSTIISRPFISTSATQVCAGEEIEFKAENMTEESRFLWNFGNADFSTETNPVRTFNEPGEYNVTLILSKSTEKIESKIIVLPKPTAEFSWEEAEKGQIKLSNLSEKAGSSEWKLDEEPISNEINPVFEYTESGRKLVTLTVVNEHGCSDTHVSYIELEEPVEIIVPSGIKQTQSFLPTLSDPEYGEVTFSIHNMKGQLIYESDTNKPWKGTMPDGTYAAPDSEFAWLVLVKNKAGKEVYSDSGKVKILP